MVWVKLDPATSALVMPDWTMSSRYQGMVSSGAGGSNLAGTTVTMSPRAWSKPTTPRTTCCICSNSWGVKGKVLGALGSVDFSVTGRSFTSTATLTFTTPPLALRTWRTVRSSS